MKQIHEMLSNDESESDKSTLTKIQNKKKNCEKVYADRFYSKL